ncbi:hypothetical protein SISNIDRAFT_451850 [Sistotremastrum niveocremeum HHB9708]|uniref:Mitochondrial import inner membrane translocase subunit n=2 Tax=Sistotremastraceae TaxID=3402574 RepID=A0A164XNQ7_9AGAM|nr:hypothetical protein SISNIDRAFT_451850 [Sistotremastrum niveocremeum HHB9708]KZT44511.1 hypothetical protein SISSUDRAFT_1039037 [Sistotremastrum suecicum HHB10207 ss-3]
MSIFGRGSSAVQSSGAINPQTVEMAVTELEMVTDVFNRIVNTCHNKCISTRYAEPDLNKGESVCVDRCVAKFFEVNKKIGEKLQAMGAANSGGSPVGGSSFGGL